jgi:hypothetical protein
MHFRVAYSNSQYRYEILIVPEGLEVDFDIMRIDVIIVPQYIAEPYRLTSISEITPLPAEISETWEEVPYPCVSKYQGMNVWSKRWATRREARAHVKGEQAWNHGLARRSAVIMALEPGVDAMELPDR